MLPSLAVAWDSWSRRTWASACIQSAGWLPMHEPSRSRAPHLTFYFHVGRLTVQANVPHGCTMSAIYIESATTRLRSVQATISITPHDCIASPFAPTSSSTRLSFWAIVQRRPTIFDIKQRSEATRHHSHIHDALLTSESTARTVDCRCCCAV